MTPGGALDPSTPLSSTRREGRWARLRRWLRPPRTLRITRTGRTYLVLTLGVGFGALNTGNNLLYLVLGLLLSLIVVSGVLSERCLRGLRVVRLGTESAFAGEPFAYRWSLSRETGPAFALSISELAMDLEGEATLAVLEPGRPTIARGELVAPRRGVLYLSGIRVTTTYPLGLFAKSRIFDRGDVLVVYPRRRPPRRSPPEESPADPGNAAGTPARGEGAGDIYGMVEQREGDDARRIHWRKSAAAGRLVRTAREREERRSVVLRVDASRPADQLDQLCEEAAANAQELMMRGFEVGLEVGSARLRPAAGPAQTRRILRALAWAGAEATL
jgi:uncharacterized protein (DUF58 family)